MRTRHGSAGPWGTVSLSALPALTTALARDPRTRTDANDRVRSGADARLSHSVPAVRRSASAGADLERRLSQRLHHRRARRAGPSIARAAARRDRTVEGAFRRSRGSRMRDARPAISTSPRSTDGCSRRGIRRSSNERQVSDAVMRDVLLSLATESHATRPAAHLVSRPRRRAARIRVRARARARACDRQRGDRAHAHVDEAQDHRQLLHAAAAHGVSGETNADAARRGSNLPTRSSSCASSIRPWAAARFSSRRVCFWPTRANRR